MPKSGKKIAAQVKAADAIRSQIGRRENAGHLHHVRGFEALFDTPPQLQALLRELEIVENREKGRSCS